MLFLFILTLTHAKSTQYVNSHWWPHQETRSLSPSSMGEGAGDASFRWITVSTSYTRILMASTNTRSCHTRITPVLFIPALSSLKRLRVLSSDWTLGYLAKAHTEAFQPVNWLLTLLLGYSYYLRFIQCGKFGICHPKKVVGFKWMKLLDSSRKCYLFMGIC